MKKLSAILFCVLLAWMQIAPLSAAPTTSPSCKMAAMGHCTAPCCDADCCKAQPSPAPKPAPAVPAQSKTQIQISLLLPATVIWTLPKNAPASFSSTEKSPLTGACAPLYAQNCVLLL